ncbi:MAG: GNAT family N-acetyltransferase [Pseudomonadota bacterium]
MTSGHERTERLMAALDATWPAAEIRQDAGWTLRRGDGGGQRVSAARGHGRIADAVAVMEDWGQPPLFCVTEIEAKTDADLASNGYRVHDPVVMYTLPADRLVDGRDETAKVLRCTARLRLIEEIWDEGGIGPARRAVMDRACGAKIILFGRAGDRPAGVVFAACHNDIAMVHALEVRPHFRNQGVGERLMRGAASWASEQGAGILALAVTEANMPARKLYEKLGMEIAARYHYRIASE